MTSQTTNRLSTGIDGLDTVLNGGLIQNRTYMLRGTAGAGKTLFGLHFLIATTETDENGLFIALEESAEDIRQNAAAIGVLKKRTNDFERNLREFEITPHGLKVGEPLSNLRGILKGTPDWITSESEDQ